MNKKNEFMYSGHKNPEYRFNMCGDFLCLSEKSDGKGSRKLRL